ncbi:hypothetical protein ACFLSJ_08525, partial [Verrucomicrobiota bacterium]
MAVSFGLFAVVLGFALIILGIVGLAASGKYAVEVLAAAVVLIGGGICLLHYGQGKGSVQVPIGT